MLEEVENSTIKRLLNRLRQLRARHALTQEAFAELSGIGYKYYQQIEAGRKRELRLSTLDRLARAYGIELHELISPALPETKVKKRRQAVHNPSSASAKRTRESKTKRVP